ncbi:SusC/RagA family TonB-linked outer membrane protein [Pseudotenacibaculum haliotis]|uniref:SusC/RagA family TonB-linked outer membrane protein n=1 Tax=Pseudotenacibaculum haliotis TaxID=1862138 RepID=A0ABW5LNC0_9FLAO
MKTKFNGILTLLLALVVQVSFAQEKTVSGTVSDADGTLPGVSVLIKGTTTGTETDFDGKYSIKTKVGDVLVFSYLGYTSVERTVGSSNTINVVLKAGEVLDEIIVTAAYDIKRAKPTVNSSVTTLSAETIEGRPNASIVQTLQGQAAGVNITTGSGQPGANSQIIVRGIGTINGDAEPLFIIDGVPVDGDNFRSLNPNNIASVNVLKDAGATAIYGNRGANGVIIITTKGGKFNSKLQVEYNYLNSYSTLQDVNFDLLGSRQQLLLERTYGNGRGASLTDAEIDALANAVDTDWRDVFFRTAVTHSHNLRLSAGSETTATNVSLGFFEQEGILQDSDLKRFNLDMKINGTNQNKKFNYGVTTSLNYSKSNEPNSIGSGAINRNYVLGAFMSVPYISPDEYTNGAALLSPLLFSNTPLFLLDRLATYTRFEEEVKVIMALNASYEIFNGVRVSSRFGMDYIEEILTRAEGPTSFNALLFAATGDNTPGFQAQQSNRFASFNLLNSINYSTVIDDKHTLDAGVYMEVIKTHGRSFGFFARGLDPRTFFPGDGSGFVFDNAANDFYVGTENANISETGLLSYFANVDYDYDKRFGFTGTLRRDASYKFRTSNRWGTFYSVAGRWNIDKEDFMEDSPFGLLKLRASWGETGNQSAGGANTVLDLYNTGGGYGGSNALIVGSVANPDFKWETTEQINVGVDFEIWDRKLTGTIDWYRKNTTGLFVPLPTPSYFGVTSISANSDGNLVNRGFDVALNYTPINTEDLRVRLNFTGNYNISERYGANITGVEEGGPLGQYFSIPYVGVNPANGNLLFLDINDNLTETPGDADRRFTGKSAQPDANGSFGFEIDYKNFFLTTQFNYTLGVDRFDFDYSDAVDPTAIGQFRHSGDLLRAWTPTNRVTDIPALRATNLGGPQGTRFLFSSDYIRLRFVQLGYNFPKDVLDKFKLNKLRMFFNAENIVTFTGWRGYDAEGFASTSRGYPTPKTVSFGLEIGL